VGSCNQYFAIIFDAPGLKVAFLSDPWGVATDIGVAVIAIAI